jgi:isoquinoline 1-oxidoreductase alpha subunit
VRRGLSRRDFAGCDEEGPALLKIRGRAYYQAPERLASGLAMTTIRVNNQMVNVDADSDTPLLWVLRDHLGMTGTKYGCGMALCGACTVHIDGAATRSCVLPLSAVQGKSITTVEGLSSDRSHAVQKAWLEIDVPQCGYCQSGQIMSAAALLKANPKPSDADIDAAMSGNICRCGTYPRIRKAIHRAAELLDTGAAK